MLNQGKKLHVIGMYSTGSASLIENNLKKVKGIKTVTVDFPTRIISVEFDNKILKIEDIKKIIFQSGFISSEIDEKDVAFYKHALVFAIWITFPSFLLLITETFFNIGDIQNYFYVLLSIPVVFYSGAPVYSRALRQLSGFSFSVEALISSGIFASFISGFFSIFINFPNLVLFSELMIIGQLAGCYLEELSKSKILKNTININEYIPGRIIKIVNEMEMEEDLYKIIPGDIIKINPGEKIPVDGIIVEGKTVIDESGSTGKSFNTDKSVNDVVICDTKNLSGIIKVKVEKIFTDSLIHKSTEYYNNILNIKRYLSRTIDITVTTILITIIILSIFTFFLWYYKNEMLFEAVKELGDICFFIRFPEDNILQNAIYAVLSTILITSPAALSFASTLVLFHATNSGLKKGFIIKNEEVIEKAGKIKAFVFDTTGILVSGEMKISDIILSSGYNEEDLITITATIEKALKDPTGAPVLKLAEERKYIPGRSSDTEFFPGKGLSGTVRPHTRGHLKRWSDKPKSVLIGYNIIKEKGIPVKTIDDILEKNSREGKLSIPVAIDNEIKGIFVFYPGIKPDAFWTIRKLLEKKYNVFIISGDDEKFVKAFSEIFSITRFYFNILPENKKNVILDIRAKFGKVCMVGNGIKDVKALAASDISITDKKELDILKKYCDILILNDKARPVIESVFLLKSIDKKIKLNLFYIFLLNIILIPFAILAIITPVMILISMIFGLIVVLWNSYSISKWELR